MKILAVDEDSGRCGWREKSFEKIMGMGCMLSKESWSIWSVLGSRLLG